MWESLTIDGIDLELFEPATPHGEGAVLLFRGQRASRWSDAADWTRQLAELGLRAIAPHRGEGWWLDQHCLEEQAGSTDMQRLLDVVIPQFESRWNIQPPRIALVGIDCGGAAAIGLAYRHARLFPIVAAIQPAVDFHQLVGNGREIDQYFESKEAARQQTAPLHLHPLSWPRKQWIATHPNDPWHEGCERLLSKLDSIGIPCERVVDVTAGTSEEFLQQQIRPALDFVTQALRSL